MSNSHHPMESLVSQQLLVPI